MDPVLGLNVYVPPLSDRDYVEVDLKWRQEVLNRRLTDSAEGISQKAMVLFLEKLREQGFNPGRFALLD
jgi:hypothetical protein